MTYIDLKDGDVIHIVGEGNGYKMLIGNTYTVKKRHGDLVVNHEGDWKLLAGDTIFNKVGV